MISDGFTVALRPGFTYEAARSEDDALVTTGKNH